MEEMKTVRRHILFLKALTMSFCASRKPFRIAKQMVFFTASGAVAANKGAIA